MGNLLKRAIAFILGMVFTLTAGVGAVIGGAYWAYKTVKPLYSLDDDAGLNDLKNQSIEDLIGLIQNALDEPDKYTFARLEQEYGIDLKKLLQKMGIEEVDASGKNWNALMGISLFNLLEGVEPLLDSIPLRALYNFLPAETLDGILSKEAQETLGNYTLLELIKSDDEGEDVGLIKALCTLKVGAFLPTYFEAKYDNETSSYNYVLNEEAEETLPILRLIGNISIGAIKNIATGGDIITELIDGGMSPIAEMPIEDIIGDLVTTISPELGKTVKRYLGALNGAKLSDLFKRNASGGYDFYYTGVVSDLKIGNLLGLQNVFGNGVWYYVEADGSIGEQAPDLFQTIANVELGALFTGGGSLDMIKNLIGDLSFGMIFDAIGLTEGTLPMLDALRGIKVSKLLYGQTDSFDAELFLRNLVDNVKDSLGDLTLAELLGIGATGSDIVDKLLGFRLSDFLMLEYDADSIFQALKEAFGNISVGDALGLERDPFNGAWITEMPALSGVFDMSVTGLINLIGDAIDGDISASQIFKRLLPELKLGDLFLLVPGTERDSDGNYTVKKGEGESSSTVEIPANLGKIFEVHFYEIVSGFEIDKPYDLFGEAGNLLIGDVVKLVCDFTDFEYCELTYDDVNNEYVWNGVADSATSTFFSLSINDVISDAQNGFEKLKNYLVHDFADVSSDMLKVFTRVLGVNETVTDGDIDALASAIKGIFSDTATLTNWTVVDVATVRNVIDLVRLLVQVAEKFVGPMPAFVGVALDEIDDRIGYVPLAKITDREQYDSIKVKDICHSLIEILKSVNEEYPFVDEDVLSDIEALCEITFNEQTIGDYPQIIYDFLVNDFATALHTLLTDIGVENDKLDDVFDLFTHAYDGVRLSGFLSQEIDEFIDFVAEALKVIVRDDSASASGSEGGIAPAALISPAPVKPAVDFNNIAEADWNYVIDSASTLLKDILAGQLNAVAFENFVVSNVIEDVQNIVNVFIVDERINAIFVQLAALYRGAHGGDDTTWSTFAEDTKNLEITKIVNAVKEITNLFLSEGDLKRIVNAAFDEIAALYSNAHGGDASTVDTFVEDSKILPIEKVVNALGNVAKVAFVGNETLIEKFENLINTLIKGTVSNWYVNNSVTIYEAATLLSDFAEEIPEDSDVLITVKNVLKTLCEELKGLYREDDKVVDIATASLNLPIVKTVAALGRVIKEITDDDGDKVIDDIVELVTYVIIDEATFSSILTAFDDSVATEPLFDGDAEIDVIINSLKKITDGLGLGGVAVLDRIYTLVEKAICGQGNTIGNFSNFDLDGLLAEMTTEEKIVAGVVVAIAAATMYFVANDTLVDLVKNILGGNDNLGAFIAQPLGYTASGNVYVFEGNENALASAIFAIKISDLLTKGYDFAALYNDNIKAKLTMDNLAMVGAAVNAKYDVEPYKTPVRALLNEIASLLKGATFETVGEKAANLTVGAVTTSLYNVALSIESGKYKSVSDKVKDLILLILDENSLIGDPKFNDSVTIHDVLDHVDGIISEFVDDAETKDLITTVIGAVKDLYASGAKLVDIAEASQAIEINKAVTSAATIAKEITPENAEIIGKIEELINALVKGPITAPEFNADVTIHNVLDHVDRIISEFVDDAETKDLITVVIGAVKDLYASGAKLVDIAEASQAIEINKAVTSAATIAKEITPENTEIIGKIVELVTYVIDDESTFSAFDINKDAEIGLIIDKAKTITDECGLSGVAVLDRVYTLAKVAIGGEDAKGNKSTLGKPFFDFDGLMAETTTTEKIIGVAAVAAVAVTMYFVANDKLVEIVGSVLGENDTLGELIAEPLGFTKSASSYTFEGSENPLASAIFELKVTDLITKGYDFSALYNDKLEPELTMKNVALVAKAVNVKYDTNKYGLAVGNELLEQIVALYGDSKVASVATTSGELYVKDVVASLEEVVKAAFDDASVQLKIEHVGTLVANLLYGQMKNVDLARDTLTVSTLCGDVYVIITDYVENDQVNEIIKSALDEISTLLGSATINTFDEKANAVTMDEVVQSVANVVDDATKAKHTAKIQHVADLAIHAVAGTLKAPAPEKQLGIPTVINDLRVIFGDYRGENAALEKVDFALGEIAKLYTYEATEDGATVTKERYVQDVAQATLDIELDDVVDAVEAITEHVIGSSSFSSLDLGRYFDIIGIAVSGTIGKPEFSFEAAWNDDRLTQTDKIVIIATAAGVGVFAYFAMNDALVSLAEKAFGDKTIGEVAGGALGYTQNAGGDWVVNGIINALTNEIFKVKVKTFLNRSEYDIIANVKSHVSLGNLLGIAAPTIDGINGALPEYTDAAGAKAKLALTKNAYGEWTLGLNELENVIVLLLNTTYVEIEEYAKAADKSASTLGAKIDSLSISDLGIGFAISTLATADTATKLGIDLIAEYNPSTKTWKYKAKSSDSAKGTYATVCNVLFRMTVKELRDVMKGSGVKGLVRTWLTSLTFGDFLGDSMMALQKTSMSSYLHSMKVEYVSGAWVADGRYKTITSNLLNMVIYDALSHLKVSTDDLLKAILKDVRAGEVFGRVMNVTATGEVEWYDEDGNKIDFNAMSRGNLNKIISDIVISDLIDNGYDLSYIIDDLYIGEIMDYVYDYEADAKGTFVKDAEGNYVAATADTPASEQRYKRVWFTKAGDKVTDTMTNIVLDYTVKELASGNITDDLKNKLDTVPVNEFFGEYNDEGNEIFHVLTEEQYNAATLGSLSEDLYDAMEVASLQTFVDMGLIGADMFEAGQPLSILVGYGGGTGVEKVTLSNLDDAVKESFSSATMETLMDIGVISLSEEQIGKLNNHFSDWESMPIGTLLGNILNKIP